MATTDVTDVILDITPSTKNPYGLELTADTTRPFGYFETQTAFQMVRVRRDGAIMALISLLGKHNPDDRKKGERHRWVEVKELGHHLSYFDNSSSKIFLNRAKELHKDTGLPYVEAKKVDGGHFVRNILAGTVVNMKAKNVQRDGNVVMPPTLDEVDDPELMQLLYRHGIDTVHFHDEHGYFPLTSTPSDYSKSYITDAAQGTEDASYTIRIWKDRNGHGPIFKIEVHIHKKALEIPEQRKRILSELRGRLPDFGDDNPKPRWLLVAEADLAEAHNHFAKEDARVEFLSKVNALCHKSAVRGRHLGQARRLIGLLGEIALYPACLTGSDKKQRCREPFHETLAPLSLDERRMLFASLATEEASSCRFLRNNTGVSSVFFAFGDHDEGDHANSALLAVVRYNELEVHDEDLWAAAASARNRIKTIRSVNTD